ncbi:MAG: energy transducer TonB [[Pasteurella] mairii]|uniref:Protein TonB n=1 Tax=[Pasteurella] mairii TaxID=757 RepID=A0A379B808_9PAST|nr:energy transducer TonB [[Pasteurella] mairii]SUB34684.1 protein TonB [[Pasteurella] mairii]
MVSKRYSWVGFFLSLLFHATLIIAIFYTVNRDSANSQAAEEQTSISIEMMMGTVMEEPEPEPQNEPEPKQEVIAKEEVADPTIKPEPKKEKPPEKKPEKPKEKVKPKEKKDKPKPKKQDDRPKSDRVVDSDAKINAVRAGNANITTLNPNLTGNGSNADELSAYRSALRREIERHKRYPKRAKMMRRQGIVTIGFTIAADGGLSNAQVVKSSGTDDLDQAALKAVQSARSIGPKPKGMGSAISVPISFKIQ